MTDKEIQEFGNLLTMSQYEVYFFDNDGGVLKRVHSIQHNHRDTKDPAELPEPVAWLGQPKQPIPWTGNCISLWLTEITDFRIFTKIEWRDALER